MLTKQRVPKQATDFLFVTNYLFEYIKPNDWTRFEAITWHDCIFERLLFPYVILFLALTVSHKENIENSWKMYLFTTQTFVNDHALDGWLLGNASCRWHLFWPRLHQSLGCSLFPFNGVFNHLLMILWMIIIIHIKLIEKWMILI